MHLHMAKIVSTGSTCRQNRLKAFTLRFDRSEYFDRAHVRGLGFLVWDTVVFGAYVLLLLGRLCSLCISLRLRKISQGPLQKSALCAILCDKE